MTDFPRVRVHADGRWAICADPGDSEPWLTHPLQSPAGPITEAVDWLTDEQVSEPGWSELPVGTTRPSRAVLNAEVASVLDAMITTAREMGEEHTAIFIDGHAMAYRGFEHHLTQGTPDGSP